VSFAVKVSATRKDCEPPPPGTLVVSRRLLRVAVAEPVTSAVVVSVKVKSTYCADALIAEPPGVVVPASDVHVPVSSAVPITAVLSAVSLAS
jgi:hypothetical protein